MLATLKKHARLVPRTVETLLGSGLFRESLLFCLLAEFYIDIVVAGTII
jgi:hypothetical protein